MAKVCLMQSKKLFSVLRPRQFWVHGWALVRFMEGSSMSIKIHLHSYEARKNSSPALLLPVIKNSVVLAVAGLNEASQASGFAFSEKMRRQIRLLQRANLNSACRPSVDGQSDSVAEILLSNIFTNIAASRILAEDSDSVRLFVEFEKNMQWQNAVAVGKDKSNEQEVLILPG